MKHKKDDFIKEMFMAYSLYVEYNMSLSQISKELMISVNTVKRRLDDLKYYDDCLYQEYRRKAKERRKQF